MPKITKKEQEWVNSVQELLTNPPSGRLGLYTIGDASLNVYDRTKEGMITAFMDKKMDSVDFCVAVNHADADFGFIESAVQIHSTAG